MTYNFGKFALLGVAAVMLSAASASPINNATRPADDVARDAARKPADMIAFAKIAPGQTIVDMLPGGGYFTRIFSQKVYNVTDLESKFIGEFGNIISGIRTGVAGSEEGLSVKVGIPFI